VAGELVTGPGLVQWGSLLLGRWQTGSVITPYRFKSVTGWQDLPGLDSGNVPRAQTHGAYAGRLLAQTRTVTLDGLMVRAPRGSIGAAIRALDAACTLAQAEQPLVVWLDDRGPMLINARLTRRQLTPDGTWSLGYSAGGALQWEATDPRRYQLAQQVAVTGLPQPESGLAWGTPTETGLAWGSPTETGLAWGTPGSTGDLACTNSGSADANPVIEFRGPCTNPSITVAGTTTVLEYNIALALGDVLTVDTWAGTVLLGGQSRLGTATLRSVPEGSLVIPAGQTSTLSFRSTDTTPSPAASCTVRWRSAYW
jgi:hypothetical protein